MRIMSLYTLAPTNNGHPRHFLKIVVDARVCNIHVNNDKVAYIGTNLGGRYAPTVYIYIYIYTIYTLPGQKYLNTSIFSIQNSIKFVFFRIC